MNSKVLLISAVIVTAIIAGLSIRLDNVSNSSNGSPIVADANTQTDPTITPETVPAEPADKIEVVHFHATQQCVSCIAVGKLALQTITEKFPDEYKSGKIVFKEVNAEEPENQAIVSKYGATGSSLYVNAIRNDIDDISEDTTVWRLYSNETQYISYFENKLKTLLGK